MDQNSGISYLKPFIWWKIFSAIFITVICAAVLIYFNFFFRKDWKTTTAMMVNEECKEGTLTIKKQSVFSSSSTQKKVLKCTQYINFEINGIEYEKTLESKDSYLQYNPIEEEVIEKPITIIYGPDDPYGTATLPFSLLYINIFIGLIIFISIIAALFYYIGRNNPYVQGYAAVNTIAGTVGHGTTVTETTWD